MTWGAESEALACFEQALATSTRSSRRSGLARGSCLPTRDVGRKLSPLVNERWPSLPRLAAAWLIMGSRRAFPLERREKALANYDRALEIDPRLIHAWHNKGNSLAALGRQEEAIACFDQALALDPKFALAWYNKGHNLAALGRRRKPLPVSNRQ